MLSKQMDFWKNEHFRQSKQFTIMGYKVRLVVSHLENKLKPKKLKQNQNSSKKTPQKLKEIIAKLKLPEIFPPTLHSIFL